MRRALGAYATALLAYGAIATVEPDSAEIVHIDSSFDSGRNRYAWHESRSGTCGRGSTQAEERFYYGIANGRYAQLPHETFRSGSIELRAVSGSSKVPSPDECGVFLYMLLGAEHGVVRNGGRPQGDFRADIRFRLKTDTSILTVLLAFGDEPWRYIALMIPAAGISAVPYTEPGRISIMRPQADLQGDNVPLRPGAEALLSVHYRRAPRTVDVSLDGRPITFSHLQSESFGTLLVPERFHEVEPCPGRRPVGRPNALIEFYSEAELDAGADSRVELLSVRMASRRRAPSRDQLTRGWHAVARPLYTAEFRLRRALLRARGKARLL